MNSCCTETQRYLDIGGLGVGIILGFVLLAPNKAVKTPLAGKIGDNEPILPIITVRDSPTGTAPIEDDGNSLISLIGSIGAASKIILKTKNILLSNLAYIVRNFPYTAIGTTLVSIVGIFGTVIMTRYLYNFMYNLYPVIVARGNRTLAEIQQLQQANMANGMQANQNINHAVANNNPLENSTLRDLTGAQTDLGAKTEINNVQNAMTEKVDEILEDEKKN